MRIPIVDEKDEIIAYKKREETTREDIRRIVVLHIFNERGEVLIAKRHPDKKIDPNCWGPSVSGTVDEEDSYEITVKRETKDELGLKEISPIFLKNIFYENTTMRRFSNVYYLTIKSNTKFSLQESEVSEIRWINLKELENMFKERPKNFISSFQIHLNIIKEIYEKIKKVLK